MTRSSVGDASRELPPDQPIRLIESDGAAADPALAGGVTIPAVDVLVRLHRAMVVARRFDLQVTALTRQGRLATYPSALGQEASEIGSVLALDPVDWLFPTYRDTIALLTRGVTPAEILAFFRGDWHTGFDPHEHRIAPMATPLATQALHAVGLATAAARKGDRTVAMAYLGDGSTSEGDTHEAFNFAAVWQAPVVFFVQNNQYAISVPLAKQSRARFLADRAVGYGMPGYVVDGNDVAAVHAVVSAALARAREGGGPTLIEALTYRLEAHTNSDDPTRYRTHEEEDEWRRLDPIARLETYLETRGAFGTDERARIAAEADGLAAATRDVMNAEPQLDPLDLFDHVYAAPRPALIEQRAQLADELAAAGDLATTESGARS